MTSPWEERVISDFPLQGDKADSETHEDSMEKKILELDLFYLRPDLEQKPDQNEEAQKTENILIELGKSAIL